MLQLTPGGATIVTFIVLISTLPDLLVGFFCFLKGSRTCQVRTFILGIMQLVSSIYLIVVSFQYGYAVSLTDSQYISSAVIILFIGQLDDAAYGLISKWNPDWAKEMLESAQKYYAQEAPCCAGKAQESESASKSATDI